MDKFVRQLLTEWRRLKLPFADGTYVAAISGGADSVALLLALAELRERKKLGHRLIVAHFDHGLRGPESGKDADFVAGLSAELGFEFVLERGKIGKRGNLEDNCRRARYEFLLKTAARHGSDGILTGHTMNDQAETLLLNLIRGSGSDGFGGMRPISSRVVAEFAAEAAVNSGETAANERPAPIRLIRPLLSWAERRETENFCRSRKIEFRGDAMNEDLKYNRVRVRKILIPLLAEFNPKIVKTLAGTAGIFGRRNDQAAVIKARDEAPATPQLSVSKLQSLDDSVVYDVIRSWLGANRGNLRGLSLKHIEAVERLARSRKSGRLVELPGRDSVIKKNGKLHFQKRKVEKSRPAN